MIRQLLIAASTTQRAAAAGSVSEANLRQGAAAHVKFSIVADFEQRGAETPLVRGVADDDATVYALWGDPGNTLNTLWGENAETQEGR